jgi:hypothetical protein
MCLTLLLCLVLPWLQPWLLGPTPTIPSILLSWFGVSIVLVSLSKSNRRIWIEPKAWAIAAVLSVLLGLVQYFGESGSFPSWISRAELGEAYANLRQCNQFPTLPHIGLAAPCWLGVQRHRHRHHAQACCNC